MKNVILALAFILMGMFAFANSNINGTTANFDWTAVTGNSTWEYILVPTGVPAPTVTSTSMYLEVDSDGSNSCDGSTLYNPWDFDESNNFGETTITLVARITPQLENDTVFRKCMNEDIDISINVLNEKLLGTSLEYVWYICRTVVQSGSDYIYTHVAQEVCEVVMVVDPVAMCKASTAIDVASFMKVDCVGIPQGISPNGDGVNDCLVLDHLEVSDGIVRDEIYNRNGVKVFELNDYTSQWCGQDVSSGNSDSNELLAVGTYLHVFQFNSGRTPITSWIYLNH